MEDKLKKRLIGAAVLVALVVIFVPMMFEKPAEDRQIKTSNIPPVPPGLEKFASSAVTPLPAERPLPPPEPLQPVTGVTTTSPAPIAPAKPEPIHTPAPTPAKALAETPPKKPPKAGTEMTHPTPPPPPPSQAAASPSPKPVALPSPKPIAAVTPSPSPTPAAKAGPGAWVVQMGAFASRENADKLAQKLRAAKFPVIEDEITVNDQVLRRIRVGPGVDRRLTEEMAASISRKVGEKGTVVRYP